MTFMLEISENYFDLIGAFHEFRDTGKVEDDRAETLRHVEVSLTWRSKRKKFKGSSSEWPSPASGMTRMPLKKRSKTAIVSSYGQFHTGR